MLAQPKDLWATGFQTHRTMVMSHKPRPDAHWKNRLGLSAAGSRQGPDTELKCVR
jgi:hypothetical protein